MATTTTSVMTNAKALAFVLDNCTLPADVSEKLTKMLEQTQKPKVSKAKQAKATENATIGAQIVDAMTIGNAYLIPDIMELIEFPEGTSNQRVTHIMTKLYEDGKVNRTKEKGKNFYSLPEC